MQKSAVFAIAFSFVASVPARAARPGMTSTFLEEHLGDLSRLDSNPKHHGVRVTPRATFKSLQLRDQKMGQGLLMTLRDTVIVTVDKAVLPNFRASPRRLSWNLEIKDAMASYFQPNAGVLDAQANARPNGVDALLAKAGETDSLSSAGVQRFIKVRSAELAATVPSTGFARKLRAKVRNAVGVAQFSKELEAFVALGGGKVSKAQLEAHFDPKEGAEHPLATFFEEAKKAARP